MIKLLYPFAPHITEELNKEVLAKDSLVYSSWPVYDDAKTIDTSFEMIVQVNGKLRDKIIVPSNITKDEMETRALNSNNIKKYIDGKEVIKVIVVPNGAKEGRKFLIDNVGFNIPDVPETPQEQQEIGNIQFHEVAIPQAFSFLLFHLFLLL